MLHRYHCATNTGVRDVLGYHSITAITATGPHGEQWQNLLNAEGSHYMEADNFHWFLCALWFAVERMSAMDDCNEQYSLQMYWVSFDQFWMNCTRNLHFAFSKPSCRLHAVCLLSTNQLRHRISRSNGLVTKNFLKIYWVCGFNLPLCACGSRCSVVSAARSDLAETSAASQKHSAAKIQPPARYAAPLTLTRRSRTWGRHQRRREGEVWRSWQTLPAPCWCELMDLKAVVCTASVSLSLPPTQTA